ncbi:hypothetical protein [Gulosibacter bifidus]|uniref:Tetratricopeptide repeat protein n=1 Tax=Gulosibacter bifidus TaxID=272239 RepID=A0ABW5RHQ2_9MICO|nr:hypothetical protein [Gulosibacter bifidus]
MAKRAAKPATTAKNSTRLGQLRRRLVLWSLPICAIAGLSGIKLIAQHVIAEIAAAQYHDSEFEASLNTAKLNDQFNVVERWKPAYLIGTDYLRLDALDEAKAQLHTALDLAVPTEQCPIRENLAIAYERAGDLAIEREDPTTAVTEYTEALAILEAADASCEQSTSARALTDSTERIRKKLEDLQQESTPPPTQTPNPTESPSPSETPTPTDTPSPSPSPEPGESGTPKPTGPDPDKLGDLEDDMEKNRRDRENDSGGYAPRPDKPW